MRLGREPLWNGPAGSGDDWIVPQQQNHAGGVLLWCNPTSVARTAPLEAEMEGLTERRKISGGAAAPLGQTCVSQ